MEKDANWRLMGSRKRMMTGLVESVLSAKKMAARRGMYTTTSTRKANKNDRGLCLARRMDATCTAVQAKARMYAAASVHATGFRTD